MSDALTRCLQGSGDYADQVHVAKQLQELEAENARLRATIDTNIRLKGAASLAVFICSRCREPVDTVYDVGSGANVEHVCVKCVNAH